MPELPDVEQTKKFLQKRVLNKEITRIEIDDPRIIRGVDFRILQQGIEKKKFTEVKRRGKYLILKTNNSGSLLIHRGLTGNLIETGADENPPRFSHAIFYMDSSALHYVDQRKFGKIAYFDTSDIEKIPDIAKLGPEPLDKDFDFGQFKEILKHHSTDIHKVLMMQEEIAGIGNVYADEICFQSGVRPDRNTNSLKEAEVRKLFENMKSVLKKAVELNADLTSVAGSYILPHRHTDHTCPLDNTHLESKRIGGRTSYYCPKHQK